MAFVGRESELEALRQFFSSEKASISVVYGRRRIGKSTLVEQAAKGDRFFVFEGLENQPRAKQLKVFKHQLEKYRAKGIPEVPKDWFEVLECLSSLAESTQDENRTTIVLLDEFQWLANYRHDIVSDLKFVWDQCLSKIPRFKLILCGSISSFMVKKVLKSKALYGRCDSSVHLKPFTVKESQQMLPGKSDEEVLLAHMLVGGVPKYLELLTDRDSVLSSLAFHMSYEHAYFSGEYDRIFVSHFGKNKHFEEIVRFLSSRRYGASRAELSRSLDLPNSGRLTEWLNDLECAGFISDYIPFDRSQATREKRYILADPYLSFYINFIEPLIKDRQLERVDFIRDIFNSPTMTSWLGYSFERLCLNHHHVIARLLGFSGISYRVGPYFRQGKRGELKGVQFDLVIERADKVIMVFEMKYGDSVVPVSVGKKLLEQIAEVPELSDKTVVKVLISKTPASRDLDNGLYFSRILRANELLA